MPRSHEDHLRPGESLSMNECLISRDGRFRLYLKADGHLEAYRFQEGAGLHCYWSSRSFRDNATIGPNATLKLFTQSTPTGSYATFGIFDAAGQLRWGGVYNPVLRLHDWPDSSFDLQSDGNVVLYVSSPTSGEVRASWAPNRPPIPIAAINRPHSVPDGKIVVDLPALGTLAIDAGTDDLHNNTDTLILVRDSESIVSVPAHETIGINIPQSTLRIESLFFSWPDPLEADRPGPPRGHSADGTQKGLIDVPAPAPGGGRRTLLVKRDGELELTGPAP